MFMSRHTQLTQTVGNTVMLEQTTATVVMILETVCSSAGSLQEVGGVENSPDFIYHYLGYFPLNSLSVNHW